MSMARLAELPDELAEHWKNVLTDAGVACELREGAEGLEIWVADGALEQARALFEPPFEGDEEPASADGPALRPDERTEPLVTTSHVVIADRLAATLHQAGLFAAIQSGTTSGVFGAEGPPQFTVVVSAEQRTAAVKTAIDWARAHTNDFSTDERVDLNDFLKIWATVLAGAGR